MDYTVDVVGSRIPEISSGPNFARGAEGSFVLQAGVSSKVCLRQTEVVRTVAFSLEADSTQCAGRKYRSSEVLQVSVNVCIAVVLPFPTFF